MHLCSYWSKNIFCGSGSGYSLGDEGNGIHTIMVFEMVDSSVMLQYLATYTSVALIEYFMNFECTHFNHL